MDIVILILVFAILAICIIYIIKLKTFKKFPTIIGFISMILIAMIIINLISQSKTIQLPNTSLDILSKIDWADRDKLLQFGFHDLRDGQMIKHIDNDIFLCSILVEPLKNQQKQYLNYKKYKSLQYLTEETSNGIFDINRFFNPTYVGRHYFFVDDNMKITISEDSLEGSDLVFDEFIKQLRSTK